MFCMVDRCQEHRREHVGSCMWCGKKLCGFCIIKEEGRKYYCEKCATTLIPVQRRTMPKEPAITPAQKPAGYSIGKDGYLNFEG